MTKALIFTICCVLGCASKKVAPEPLNYTLEMFSIREILTEHFPEVLITDNLPLTLLDIMHRRAPVANGTTYEDLAKPADNVYKVLITQENAHICGGFAETMQQIFLAYDIPSRLVGLYTDNTLQPETPTHAVLEYHNGEKWIAVDSLFGTYYSNAGEFLNYEEMRALGSWTTHHVPSPGNWPGVPDTLAASVTFYADNPNLMSFVAIYPGYLNGQNLPGKFLPSSWNGYLTITTEDQPFYTGLTPGSYLRLLYEGVLPGFTYVRKEDL